MPNPTCCDFTTPYNPSLLHSSTTPSSASLTPSVANILAVTNVRITPDSNSLWRYIELLESEMSERAMEELDRNRRKPQAHLGDAIPLFLMAVKKDVVEEGVLEDEEEEKKGVAVKIKDKEASDHLSLTATGMTIQQIPGQSAPISVPTVAVPKEDCARNVTRPRLENAYAAALKVTLWLSLAECRRPRRDPTKGGKGGKAKAKAKPKAAGGHPRANNADWLAGPQEGWEDHQPNPDNPDQPPRSRRLRSRGG
eukprot:5463086-Amphidinium_carterae.1